MKKAKHNKEMPPESLPFSFLKKDIDEKTIKAHWEKIKEKIEQELPGAKDTKTDNNLL